MDDESRPFSSKKKKKRTEGPHDWDMFPEVLRLLEYNSSNGAMECYITAITPSRSAVTASR
jgi:hypothetical protein